MIFPIVSQNKAVPFRKKPPVLTSGKNTITFSGKTENRRDKIGRNDMQNLLMPKPLLRLYSAHIEHNGLWKKANSHYQNLKSLLKEKNE